MNSDTVKKYKVSGIKLAVKPEVAGKHLMRLYKRNKKELTPQVVVDDAKHPESPLHPCFEWNNRKAADKFRLHQARHIINCVVIERQSQEDEEPIEYKAFINIQKNADNEFVNTYMNNKGTSYYMSIDDAMDDPETREYTLDMAKRELFIFRKKYRSIQKLEKLFLFIEEHELGS